MYGTIFFPVAGASLPGSSGIGQPRDGGARLHEGLDIFGAAGSSVVSATSGTVLAAGEVGGKGGVIVKVRDQFGNVHYYAHLDPRSVGVVRAGQQIQAGQSIGFVGNTGNATNTAAHLHYSINEASGGNSNLYDPWHFLQSGNLQQAPGPGATSGNATPDMANEELNIPTGGEAWSVDGQYYALFWIRGQNGAAAAVYYQHNGPPPPGATGVTRARWDELTNRPGYTDAGSTEAFRGVPAGKSWDSMVNDVLMELGLQGTDALNDAGVLAIVGLAMSREISPEELANRLRRTAWYQSRTDSEREWDDLSEAEQNSRLVDEAMKLGSLYFTYVGEDLDMGGWDRASDGTVDSGDLHAGNYELWSWAQKIASGQVTQAQAVNTWLKKMALENPNSPWSRTIREEEQAAGQHGVDVENMTGQIQDLFIEWGIPLTDQKAAALADQVVMNQTSMEDIEDELEGSASALYPNKPKGMSTRQWAEPYMQSYMSTLETPEVNLTDPLVQRGLAEGQTLADFQKMLRHDGRWLDTKNARAEFNDKISSMGRVMGF